MNCVECGKSFKQVVHRGGGRLRKSCSDECRVARAARQSMNWARLYRYKARKERKCAECTKTFLPPMRSGPPAKFCSAACKIARKTKMERKRR